MDSGGLAKVASCIHTVYYKDEPVEFSDIVHKFTNVANELMDLPELGPCSESIILLREVIDDSDPEESELYIDVCLSRVSDEETFALDFVDWREIIDMDIRCEKKLDNHGILCHILWEITFWGFSNDSMLQSGRDLLKYESDVIKFELPEDE